MANRNRNPININTNFYLNDDQRMLVNMYINQYNQVSRQVHMLYNHLDDIRTNIQSIINHHQEPRINRNLINSYRMRRPRFTNTSLFDNLFGSNQNNQYLFYDYENPINPNLYVQQDNNHNSGREFLNILNSFLNTNVIVRPTEQQINNATSLVRYSTISNPTNDSCPISLENFQSNDNVRIIHHCGHIFNPNSFNQWFRNNVRCPVCRYDIRDYNPNHNDINNSNIDETHNVDDSPNIDNELDDSILDNVEIEQRDNIPIYDLSNNELTNSFLTSLTDRLIQNLFNFPSNNNSNSGQQLYYDPSNNVLVYESIIRR